MREHDAGRADRAAVLLILPPLLFAAVVVGFSVVVGFVERGDPEAIAAVMPGLAPWMLLANHLVLGLFLLWRLRRAGWHLRDAGWGAESPLREAGLGVLLAIPLASLNQWGLLPATRWLARAFGDYVPAEQVDVSLASGLLPTAVAALFLAPLIEETLYRGAAWRELAARWGPGVALVSTSLAFGPLHWAQGLWPMLYAVVAALLYGAVRAWRGNVIAAAVVHFAFNAFELALLQA